MNEKKQNCCLMITSSDKKEKTMLTYIPLNVDYSMLEGLLENGVCNNNVTISFELEESADEFWMHMWDEL